ncbi:hypothetical protein F5050DRAFT_1809922 [Lentinula boryana]|uniref:DUF659 domain-containing protein n=1 Tax=Lentinula boryana TaxID=40481 RepID=A0ABQ8Q6L5_9AGAR|nr:hypothetical protein F5050DRAFT_1809922 [Lentinula boryana]
MKAKKSGDTEVTGSGAEATKPAKKWKHQSDLDSVVDQPMLELFIHANISFNTANNIFLSNFTNELQPSFKPASRFVMTQTFLDSEYSYVHLETVDALAEKLYLEILLIDGWEDILQWSIYGVATAHVGKPSVVLGLCDLTGHQGNAAKIVEMVQSCLKEMGVVDARYLLAVVTDNPSVMQKFCKEIE